MMRANVTLRRWTRVGALALLPVAIAGLAAYVCPGILSSSLVPSFGYSENPPVSGLVCGAGVVWLLVIGEYAWLLRSQWAQLSVFVASSIGLLLGDAVQQWNTGNFASWTQAAGYVLSPSPVMAQLLVFTVFFGWWLLILTAVVTRTSKNRYDASPSVWVPPTNLSALDGQTPTGALLVSPISMTTTAQATVLPPIMVTNIGQNAVVWSASTTQPGLAISPQSGALHPGQSQSVAVITGGKLESVCDNPDKPEFTILFNGASQPRTVTVTVTCHRLID
jgi:hypothetical protein